MKPLADLKTPKPFAIKALALGIAANTLLLSGYSHAGPTGGVVTDGGGSITQSGTETRIDQSTQRLSLQWNTFNIDADERVQFVQPNNTSTALNRIMDNNGSRILGQIDANGHVILMNPNGIFFGQDATVNVGGLVASGLNINSDDFMNGDLAFAAIEGTAGTVINHGLINASTGGNVALLGKSVANHGLISAKLGHVALAAGSEAVVTFDVQGLIGVRIDQETLASEVGVAGAVNNAGTLEAKGGKILLNASVSADLFSAAVNRGNLNNSTEAIVHSDGSFSLGAGNRVVNTGTADVSTDASSTSDAGYVVVAGDTIEHRGTLRANAEGSNRAGQVYIRSGEIELGAYSVIEASNPTLTSGKVSVNAVHLRTEVGAQSNTSGNTMLAVGELETPMIDTNHLYISNITGVQQKGSIIASGNTHLNLVGDISYVRFTDADNDFNTLSMETDAYTNTIIHDSNDIEFGLLKLLGAVLRVETLGEGATISQSANSDIYMDNSSVTFKADNILLGENANTTTVSWGSLGLNFAQQIDTNQSITLIQEDGFSPSSARIMGTDYASRTVIDLSSDQAIDLAATIDENDNLLTIGNMVGSNASLEGLIDTIQTGPIKLTDTLSWDSGNATLEHVENDVGTLTSAAQLAFSRLSYVDKNDVIIGDMLNGPEIDVNIKSVGAGATIRQADNTTLRTDFIALDSDNIDLGANGTSTINAGYVLEVDFSDTVHINGPYTIGSYAPYFRITGDGSENTLIFGEHATSDSFSGDELLASVDFNLGSGKDTAIFDSEFMVGNTADWGTNSLNMGTGNDKVYLNKSVNIPITLGPGRDTVRIWDFDTYFDITDFHTKHDRLRVHLPLSMR